MQTTSPRACTWDSRQYSRFGQARATLDLPKGWLTGGDHFGLSMIYTLIT
jgi:hypothetical protein